MRKIAAPWGPLPTDRLPLDQRDDFTHFFLMLAKEMLEPEDYDRIVIAAHHRHLKHLSLKNLTRVTVNDE